MTTSSDWPKGKKFRLLKAGYLDGMIPMRLHPNAHQGWQQQLSVGDVITCEGYGPGWGSDPGYGVHFSTPQSKAEHVVFAEFRPMAGGLFNYRPADGWLEPVEEEAPISSE
jgi:hypothetical protein